LLRVQLLRVQCLRRSIACGVQLLAAFNASRLIACGVQLLRVQGFNCLRRSGYAFKS
jgi:hypothetical protein